MYAITGITGNTGKIVAEKLLADGKRVRGVFRTEAKAEAWRARGVEVVIGELSDAETLTRLFRGAEGAYIMTPTYHDAPDMFQANAHDLASLKRAAVAAGLPKAVLLSSVGAHLESGTGPILKLHELEKAFFDLPISCTAIRAAWFMENFAGTVAGARENGVFPSFLSPLDRAVPMVATRDVGLLAADVLQGEWKGRRVLELEGPRRYSPDEVAAVLASVLGRPVTAAMVNRSEWVPIYRSFGFSPRSAEAVAEMVDGFNREHIVFEKGSAQRVYGKTSLDAVLQEIAGSGGMAKAAAPAATAR